MQLNRTSYGLVLILGTGIVFWISGTILAAVFLPTALATGYIVHYHMSHRRSCLEHIAKLETELFGFPEHTPFSKGTSCRFHRYYTIRDTTDHQYRVCMDCGNRHVNTRSSEFYRPGPPDRQWLNSGIWSDDPTVLRQRVQVPDNRSVVALGAGGVITRRRECGSNALVNDEVNREYLTGPYDNQITRRRECGSDEVNREYLTGPYGNQIDVTRIG